MAVDVLALWSAVADAAWGGADGGIDEGRCVPGSFRQASLLEQPPAPPAGEGGSADSNSGSGSGSGSTDAAAALDSRWGLALLLAFAVGITFV